MSGNRKSGSDFGIRVPSPGLGLLGNGEKSFDHGRSGEGILAYLAKLDNSPSASVMAFCLSSISMTVVNKYVVSGDHWNLNFFYLAVQSLVCIVAILACSAMGLIKVNPFDPKKGKQWLPISVLFVGMLYTGAKSLQFLSVPVYTIFKNLTIIAIAYGEVIWFGGRVSSLALLSFVLIVLSSVIAAWSDIQTVFGGAPAVKGARVTSTEQEVLIAGYIWMALNVFCTAAYSLTMRLGIKKTGFKDWDTTYTNNLLTIPILIISSLLVEDWTPPNLRLNFPIETRNALLTGMIYSGVCGIFISYATPWCIRTTSATTYAMVGALNKLPIAISGFVFFGTVATLANVSAIIVGFISGLVYAAAKVRQQKANQAKNVLPRSVVEGKGS